MMHLTSVVQITQIYISLLVDENGAVEFLCHCIHHIRVDVEQCFAAKYKVRQ